MILLSLACVSPSIPSGRADVAGGEADSAAPTLVPGGDGTEEDPPDPSDTVFDVGVIHHISLVMAAEDWADIQTNPWSEAWHTATFEWVSGTDGTVEDVGPVGVRAFGAGSEIATKPALKISFDKFVPGQRWRTLEQLKLDNSSQDAGFMNERLGTSVLRDMALPAARTGWAEVSVNGSAAGFFVALEPIDDRFLRRWYADADGPLYGMVSGYYSQGLNPFPAGYTDPFIWYDTQTSVESDGSDLIEATRLLAEGTDEEVDTAIDLDEFTRVSVARSVMGGIDTFSADGNNYYLYSDRGRLSQIAWDLDADLGYPWAFSNAFTVDPRQPWVTSPWSHNPVTGAAYTDPVLSRHLAMGADPDAIVDEMLAGPFAYAKIDAEIVASADVIRDAVNRDVLGYGPSFDPRISDLRMFVHERASALAGFDVADCAEPDDGGWPVSALSPAGTVGWGELLIDKTYWGPGFSVRGEHYCRGVFAHAPSDVSITVPVGADTVTGRVGIQDWVQVCGNGVAFEIWQGGVQLWSSGIVANYAAAVDIGSVAVTPGSVHLVVTPNGEYSCDTAAWLDVRVR